MKAFAPLFTMACLALASGSSHAATVLSQDFDTDPINYSASAFAFQASDPSRYWGPSDLGMTVNPGVTGNATVYLAGQNMDGDGDGTLTFLTGAPAQVDFAVDVTLFTNLELSIDLAGMPTAEPENFIRAFLDGEGDGFYETQVFNFMGTGNAPYTDPFLGQSLSANFATFSGLPLPAPTSPDGFLRLRLEVFNDTNNSNEAAGIDNILISGVAIPEPGALLLLGAAGFAFVRRRGR